MFGLKVDEFFIDHEQKMTTEEVDALGDSLERC